MPKNHVVGKPGGHNKSTGRDYSKEAEWQSSEKQKKYRAELNRKNRDAGTYGNGDKKDMSHTKSGKMVSESQSANRSRNGKDGHSTKK